MLHLWVGFHGRDLGMSKVGKWGMDFIQLRGAVIKGCVASIDHFRWSKMRIDILRWPIYFLINLLYILYGSIVIVIRSSAKFLLICSLITTLYSNVSHVFYLEQIHEDIFPRERVNWSDVDHLDKVESSIFVMYSDWLCRNTKSAISSYPRPTYVLRVSSIREFGMKNVVTWVSVCIP